VGNPFVFYNKVKGLGAGAVLCLGLRSLYLRHPKVISRVFFQNSPNEEHLTNIQPYRGILELVRNSPKPRVGPRPSWILAETHISSPSVVVDVVAWLDLLRPLWILAKAGELRAGDIAKDGETFPAALCCTCIQYTLW
jgi:hypothetical protein